LLKPQSSVRRISSCKNILLEPREGPMRWTNMISAAANTLTVLVAASACSDGTTAPSRLVAEDSPSRYESVWERGIEWVLVDGEWYPTVETADAVIENPSTSIGLSGNTAYYWADMYGYWDHITETIRWSFSGSRDGQGTAVKTAFTSVSPGSKYKRALNNHIVSNVPTCNVTFNADTDHAAWFGRAVKVTMTAGGGGVPGSVSIQYDTDIRGRADATTFADPKVAPRCEEDEECGPLRNLQPTNPFTLAKSNGALPSPTASFECEPQSGGEQPGSGYDGGLCYCQQWFLMVAGQVVDEWWDCYDESGNPVDACYIS
jgi:hypothetical protein